MRGRSSSRSRAMPRLFAALGLVLALLGAGSARSAVAAVIQHPTARGLATSHIRRPQSTANHGSMSEPNPNETVAPCPPNGKQAKYWTHLDGSHPFRLWYDARSAAGNQRSTAIKLVKELDSTIWHKLTTLMGVVPVSDPLNICLVPSLPGGALGDTHAKSGCDKTAAYIDMLGSLSEKTGRDVLAHEFMHVLQFALNVSCGDQWWRESTGEWAENFVYPTDNREHTFSSAYMTTTEDPLDKTEPTFNRYYGEYLFALLIQHLDGPKVIGTIWRREEKQPLLKAIDDSVSGGLNSLWPQFALDNWNHAPADVYEKWDGGKPNLDAVYNHVAVTPLTDGGGEQDCCQWDGIKHLSALYQSFTFDKTVRTVTVSAGFTLAYNPDFHMSAIVGINNNKPSLVDLTVPGNPGKAGAAFCLDRPDEHITSLVLVMSNSSATKNIAPDTQDGGINSPVVAATGAGCRSWSGDLRSRIKGNGTLVDKVHLHFAAQPTFPTDFQRGTNFAGADYVATSGRLTWKESGKYGGCTYGGSFSRKIAQGFVPMAMLWRTTEPLGDYRKAGFFGFGGSIWNPTGTETVTCSGHTEKNAYPVLNDLVQAASTPFVVHGLAVKGGISANGNTWKWSLTSPG